MSLLQNDFIKQLSLVVLSTLLFVANCAFVFIPGALGSVPGQPLARGIAPPLTTLVLPDRDVRKLSHMTRHAGGM